MGDQIVNIHWIMEKTRTFQKNIYFCFTDSFKPFDCVDHNKLWKSLQVVGVPDTSPVSWETCMQVKKQQLEPDMEQWTGSKLGKLKVKPLSRVQLFATRQECWSGLPFPSPGNLPNPGIKPASPSLQADALLSEPPGKPQKGLKELKRTRENQKGLKRS